MKQFRCNYCYYQFSTYLNKISCEAIHMIHGVCKKYRRVVRLIEE